MSNVLVRPFLLLLGACTAVPPEPLVERDPPEAEVVLPPPAWPEKGAPLFPPVLEVPPEHVPQTVFLVAGHGAPGNEGNLGATCIREQDFTLDTTDRLARMLNATGQFRAVRAREGDARPSYAARLRHLERAGATALIELHSDARADAVFANGARDGEVCWRDDGEPGFTILVRDRGVEDLVSSRLRLARSLATALTDAGFPPWVGDNYQGLYEADEVAGVWLDRRRLFMLDRPAVPSVIIETHNARDGREPLRWKEARTHDVFGRAVLAGLLAFYGS